MTPLLELDHVTVSRNGSMVLRDVSLALGEEERLAITGPNGAGKTSLLRTLIGLDCADAGTVRLFGTPCEDEAAFRKCRPAIGFLFQDSDDQLFCPTVIEDVAFGPLNLGLSQSEALNRAGEVLEQLGISTLSHRVTHRLSGGEKRLVCLAGLLAMRPRLLLLDEPTNGVDAPNGRLLTAALKRFGGAMIVASHDDALVAELATRIITIRDGRILEAKWLDHRSPSALSNEIRFTGTFAS